MAVALTSSTEPSSTTAVANGNGFLDAGHLGRKRVEVHGQRHALVVQAVGKQVALLHRLEEDRAGEHDRRGFARRPADLEDDAGENAADRIGQHDRLDRLPAGGADVPARLAETARHAGQGLAGAGDDDRQRHDRQGQRRRDDRVAEPGGIDERTQAEQRVHDARHAGQVDDRQVDDAVEPVVPGVLVQVNRRQDADRRGDGQRKDNQVDGSDQAPARCRLPSCRASGTSSRKLRLSDGQARSIR